MARVFDASTLVLTAVARRWGVPWMNRAELSEAIPPAYTEFIGRQLIHCPALKKRARRGHKPGGPLRCRGKFGYALRQHETRKDRTTNDRAAGYHHSRRKPEGNRYERYPSKNERNKRSRFCEFSGLRDSSPHSAARDLFTRGSVDNAARPGPNVSAKVLGISSALLPNLVARSAEIIADEGSRCGRANPPVGARAGRRARHGPSRTNAPAVAHARETKSVPVGYRKIREPNQRIASELPPAIIRQRNIPRFVIFSAQQRHVK